MATLNSSPRSSSIFSTPCSPCVGINIKTTGRNTGSQPRSSLTWKQFHQQIIPRSDQKLTIVYTSLSFTAFHHLPWSTFSWQPNVLPRHMPTWSTHSSLRAGHARNKNRGPLCFEISILIANNNDNSKFSRQICTWRSLLPFWPGEQFIQWTSHGNADGSNST